MRCSAGLFARVRAASPAAADSILFVRDGNVWISTPDGSTERPLTAGGGFSSPSMADDGTIVALRGRSFVRLRPDGAAIGMPLDAIGGDWIVGGGPYDARVSPDGLKIAYWFTGPAALLPAAEPGCSLQDTDVTAYAYASRVTDPLELGVVRDRRQPSWYGAGRALVFRHGVGTGEAVSVNRVGRGEADDQGWFSYDDGTSLEQGQLDHGGTRLAAVAGGNQIHLFGVSQPPPALPALRCVVPGGPYASPTWSPDGTMLAWEQADGVHVAGPVPDLRQPVPDCSVIAQRRLTAGTDPYWGRADVPARRREAAARQAGGAQASAGVPLAAGGAAPARERGRLRLRISRGPARVTVRLPAAARPPAASSSGARGGDAAPARPAQREGEARAGALRPPRAAAARDRARTGPGDHDGPPPGGRQACLTRGSDRATRKRASPRARPVPDSHRAAIDRRTGFRCRSARRRPPQWTGFRSWRARGTTGEVNRPPGGSPCPSPEWCSPLRVAALAVMLIGGAGPAAAQTSTTPLTKTVKMTGTAKNGKKFKGTYTIKRFTHSGSKLYAVGTVKGRLKGRRVTKNNVRIPV